jgi:hypothetical protein
MNRKERRMRNSLVPKPWRQVGLTILPGLILLLGSASSSLPSPLDTGVRYSALAVMLLLLVSSILWAAAHRDLFQVPVWGFIPLGVLASLISMMFSLGFFLTCLLLVITGLVFAKHNGLNACLFVLMGGILSATAHIEPGMYLRTSGFREIVINVGMIVLFLIFTPIIVLRSRSILVQAAGLLLPLATYVAAFVLALSSESGLAHPWFNFSISQSVSIASPFLILFATIAIAAPVYAWIASRHFAMGEAQHQSTVL